MKTAIHNVIRRYISMDFDGFTAQFWGDNYFKLTDWHPDGYYWDMYSNTKNITYSSVSMSREHCLPRSWWGNTSDYGDANSDLFNLYPADYDANSKKSNLPMGEVGIQSWNNGIFMIGQNTFPNGYLGTVFEPADQYKGDFARTYFYMVTCYEDYASRWQNEGISSMLNNETYPVFKEWALEMLLKWHRQDPVSKKEIDRNNNVFKLQMNRNPFIDHPELVEYIWGDKIHNIYSVENKATKPTLLSPTNNAIINFGTNTNSRYIYIKGLLITKPIKVELLSGDIDNFSIQSEITPNDALDGVKIPVKYSPKSNATHNAIARISSEEIGMIDINLTGSKLAIIPPVDPVTPSEDMDVIYFQTAWDKNSLTSDFVTNSTGIYANGDLGFKADGQHLTITFNEVAEILQFAVKPYNAWGNNNNHLYVYESTDTKNWGVPIADIDNTMIINNGYYNTDQIALQNTSRAIKIQYKKVSQNVGINNLILTRPSTTSINTESIYEKAILYIANGVLSISNIRVGSVINIYTISGDLIYKNLNSGESEFIKLDKKGVYIIKIENKVYKIIY